MKTFRFDELFNSRGQFIGYFSNSNGETELEKYLNSFVYRNDDTQYIVNFNGQEYTCIVRYNDSSHYEDCGYYLMVFNSNGELLHDTFPSYKLYDNTIESVNELLGFIMFE